MPIGRTLRHFPEEEESARSDLLVDLNAEPMESMESGDAVFTLAKLAAIQDTVSSTVQAAFNRSHTTTLSRLLPRFSALQCNPIGVVPKKHSTEWRTIYHLSYRPGDSVNGHIPKDPYSLQYVRVDDAISILKSLGSGAYMAKTDLKSAFRIMPIHWDDWNLLGIYWQSRYYVDLYLPFALRSSPFLFNQISEALEWILKHIYAWVMFYTSWTTSLSQSLLSWHAWKTLVPF